MAVCQAELCDTLTSSVLLFDVDSSEGLDWDEFQVFNTAIVDVVMDHAVDGKFSYDRNEKLHKGVLTEAFVI